MVEHMYYQNFIYHLRKLELSDIYLAALCDNISPKLCEYCFALDRIRFVDGSYHTYFGDIKKVIDQFVNYWNSTINHVIKNVDKYTHFITKDELVDLVEQTININKIKQVDFGKEFLPVKTKIEQEMYEEIEEKYKAMLESLLELQTRIERFDTQSAVEEYVRDNMEFSIKKITECLDFTHTYISIKLSENVCQIKVSLEDTLARVRHNLKELEDKRDRHIATLRNELYDKNKEHLHIWRRDKRSSVEYAEVSTCIARLQHKIATPFLNMPIVYLTNEVDYWERRLADLISLQAVSVKIKKAQENLRDLEREYNKMSTTELPGSRYTCFTNMAENIKRRKEYLDDKMLEASKALLTFFGVRGLNRVLYEDHIGKYMMDEYGHQLYYFEHGKHVMHVTCDGSFREVQHTDKYYYDDGGRYIKDESGKKIYQVAPCTSSYELGKDNILFKTTIDCGHSVKVNPKCRMELKDPNDVEILPNLPPIDIKGTLTPEEAKYLWDCFGHIVPEAMRDVGVLVPKNPIHILAHKITADKYSLTLTEIKKLSKKAEEYRAEIFKKRKDKAIAESKAWRSKQVKRRKPEESDDSQDWVTYNSYLAQNQFISFLNYNDD